MGSAHSWLLGCSLLCLTTVSGPHQLMARPSPHALRCHNDCIKVLALMVTGDNNPSGSKILHDSLKTSLFVTSEVMLGIGDLDMRDSVSVCVSHCRPRTLTGLLASTTLSLDAYSVSWGLLEAQLLKLKLASFIME